MANLRSIRNKFDDLLCHILIKQPGLIICSETWLNSEYPNEAFGIPGYVCHRADRQEARGGGVAVWVKRCYRCESVHFNGLGHVEICAVKLIDVNLLICGIYIPPGLAASAFNQTRDDLQSALDNFLVSFPNYNIIIAGDFNQYNMSFLDQCFSLRNIVRCPTRLSANLDHIYIDKSLLDKYNSDKVEVGPPIGKSDHRSIFVHCETIYKKRSIRRHVVYDLRESHVLAFEKHFAGCRIMEALYQEDDLDGKCDIFYKFMYESLSKIPRRTVFLTESDVPWMTPFLKYLIDQRWQAYRNREWNRFNAFKDKIKRLINSAKAAFVNKKKNSVKDMWSYVKYERGSQSSDLSSLFGEQYSSVDVLDSFNEHFCSFMSPSSSISALDNLPDDDWMPCVHVYDVWKALKNLSPKATGSDNIPTLLYKKASASLAEPIHHLLTECYRMRRFPLLWKVADVVPVPKPGKLDMLNLRPISLLPIPAKLAEKFALDSMKTQMTTLLGSNQFGIRKNSSTTHAVITAHDMLTRHADDPNKAASMLICFDFSKAFDKVPHNTLLRRLNELRLPTGFCLLMNNYLSDRRQCVRYNGECSNIKRVTSGVPQGSLLGPYLFGLFVSSLEPVFPKFTCMVKYVDDICMVFGIQKEHGYLVTDVRKVQSELSNLIQWSSVNGLALNTKKTTGLVRYKGMPSYHIEFLLPSIKFQSSIRLLGVIFDQSFGWKCHVDLIERKCSQRLYILRRIRAFLSQRVLLDVYCGLIRSLLEYACPLFLGMSVLDSRRLQRIQDRCLRIIGVNSSMVDDLSTRRNKMALQFLQGVSKQDTVIKELLPATLRSGRIAVPFCHTSIRQKSFFPFVSLSIAHCHCD